MGNNLAVTTEVPDKRDNQTDRQNKRSMKAIITADDGASSTNATALVLLLPLRHMHLQRRLLCVLRRQADVC